MDQIRPGDAGPAVADVQDRLRVAGIEVDDVPGRYGAGTADAVRRFQQSRGLRADGAVGDDTWVALVDAAHALGDRLLYERRPELRGDDVVDLQARLSRLGFDAGTVDGRFGPLTGAAVRDFQHNCGIEVDGIVGAETVSRLRALHRDHQHVTSMEVLERLAPPAGGRSLATGTIMLDPVGGPAFPGQVRDGVPEHDIAWDVARRTAGQLIALGATTMLSRGRDESPDATERAHRANRADVDALVAIRVAHLDHAEARGVASYFFGSDRTTSPEGRRLAGLVVRTLSEQLRTPDCRSHPSRTALLRETRSPAVVAEIGFLSHEVEGAALLTPAHRQAVSRALSSAVRAWWADAEDGRG